MALAAANGRYDDLHKEQPYHDGTFTFWAKDRSRAFPYHYRDGVSIWVTREDLSPDDDFLEDGSVVAGPEQSDGDVYEATDQPYGEE